MEQVEASYGGVTNGYLVAFKSRLNTIGCQDIFGVLVDALAAPVATSASLLSSNNVTTECELTADDGLGVAFSSGTDNWFVAWKNRDNDQASGRIVGRSGTDIEPTTAAVTLGAISNGAPTVIYDPAGAQFLVAWSGPGVMARFVSTSGTAVGAAAMTVNGDATLSPRRPRMAFDAATSTFVFVAHDEALGDVWSWELASGSAAPGTATLLAAGDSVRPTVDAARGCIVTAWTQTSPVSTVLAAATCVGAVAPELAATGADGTVTFVAIGAMLIFAAGAAVFIAATTRRKGSATR